MALITCPECGRKKVSDTAEACPSCGFGIKAYFEKKYEEEENKEKEIKYTEPEHREPEHEEPKNENGNEEIRKKDSGKKPYILYALLALLVVCVLLFVFLKQKPHDEDSQLAIAPTESGEAVLETESIEASEHSDENNSEISSETESEVNSEEEDPVKESKYIEANELLSTGGYDEAREIFAQLDSYKDSKKLLKECDYQKAEILYGNGDDQAAKDIYLTIERYEDSHDKILECTYNIAYSYYQAGDYLNAAILLYEPGTGQLLHKESDDLRKLMAKDNRSWFIKKAKEEFNKGNFDNAGICYQAVGGRYKLSDQEKADYDLNLFMIQIQGEYTAENRPGIQGIISGYNFTQGDVTYKITPMFKRNNGFEKLVGLLDGQDGHYLESSEEGSVSEISDKNGGTHWSTEAWRIKNTDRVARRESEQAANDEKAKEEKAKKEAEERAKAKNVPAIGMTADEVRNSSWGEPKKINKTTYEWGTSEQWVYSLDRYVYLENGRVTAIQE